MNTYSYKPYHARALQPTLQGVPYWQNQVKQTLNSVKRLITCIRVTLNESKAKALMNEKLTTELLDKKRAR